MNDLKLYHRFIDEAGDTTFYLKGKRSAIGTTGVSNVFMLGMLTISEPLDGVRNRVMELQKSIATDPFYAVPSVIKKNERGGYYLHATDDLPEIRKMFFDMIKTINCSMEIVVGRKSIERFETKHKGQEEYFYADLVSHLLKDQFLNFEKLVLNISEKGSSTKQNNLNLALEKAKQRFGDKHQDTTIKTNVIFNVQNPTKEPLLNIADYLCWAVQRVMEKGEVRYYNSVREKVKLVIDLYDVSRYKNMGNYYDNETNPLKAENKISSHIH